MKIQPEELLAYQLHDAGIEHERQFRHTQTRRWRWDFRVGTVLIDVQGGTHVNGRHNRGQGYQNDCDKANHAVIDGWVVLRFTTQDVETGKAIEIIREAKKLEEPWN